MHLVPIRFSSPHIGLVLFFLEIIYHHEEKVTRIIDLVGRSIDCVADLTQYIILESPYKIL